MATSKGDGEGSEDRIPDASAKRVSAPGKTHPLAKGEGEATEEVQAELDEEIADTLKQFNLSEDQVRLIAPRLRQVFLSVEHTYERSDVEGIGEAAQAFEHVAPGRGQQLLDAFLDEYRSQTRRQDREQQAQHVALYAGLTIAAVVALFLIGGAIYAISVGAVWGAGAFLGAAAISMVAGFIDASTRRRKADRG